MKQTRRQFVRTLFAASQGIMAASFLPTRLLAASAVPASAALNFLIFGDWGRQGELDQTEVAGQMARAATDTGAQFIVSVGDNFYENGVTSTTDDHWRKSFEDVYAAPPLQIPWHVILGNHDYHGDCDAQIAYARLSSRWHMPARYFQFSCPVAAGVTADFFFIDTTPMVAGYYWDPRTRNHVKSQDVPAQLAWFQDALAKSTAPWKIVIGHHPIYSGGGHGDTSELIKKILPLLHEYKVQAYFNGHDHDLQHLIAGDVNLICSGAGSQVRTPKTTKRTKFAMGCSGFTTVSIQANQMNIRMIDATGKTVYGASWPREAAKSAQGPLTIENA